MLISAKTVKGRKKEREGKREGGERERGGKKRERGRKREGEKDRLRKTQQDLEDKLGMWVGG